MLKKLFKLLTLSAVGLFAAASLSWAAYMAEITYDYTGGPNNYTLDFTVNNLSDGASTGALDYFEIVFDTGADKDDYSAITWVDDRGWFSLADDPVPGFGNDAGIVLADDSADFGSGGGGIAQSNSLGGFKVNFDYAGGLDPTLFSFSWYANFGTSLDDNGGIYDQLGDYYYLGEAFGETAFLDSGDPGLPPIPEPGTMILFGLGLLGLAGFGRKES